MTLWPCVLSPIDLEWPIDDRTPIMRHVRGDEVYFVSVEDYALVAIGETAIAAAEKWNEHVLVVEKIDT